MANCLLYCCSLNTFLGTWTCLWAWTITDFFVVSFTCFFNSIYFQASLSLDSNVSGVTLHSWTVPVKSSSSWRILEQTDGWASVWLVASPINTLFCALSPSCTCITTHSKEPSSMTTLFLLYPLSITTSYPSLHLPLPPPFVSCGNVNRLWWSSPAH